MPDIEYRIVGPNSGGNPFKALGDDEALRKLEQYRRYAQYGHKHYLQSRIIGDWSVVR